MAADGRRSWGHFPTSRSRGGESETVQKIFEITRQDAALAYFIRGDTINENMSWDIAAEMKSSVASLSAERFADSSRFIQALCLGLRGQIEHAKDGGLLDGYPTSEISIAGYFRDSPCWVEVQFRPYQSRLTYQVSWHDCVPGRNFMTGSEVLNRMIQSGDPRIADLFDGLDDQNMTLEAGQCFARKYVEMCCTPLIRGLEPDGCKTIGGHIHVATVTPRDRTFGSKIQRWLGRDPAQQAGFRWIRPPLVS